MAFTAHPSPPRVALVHDFLLDLRGGERVFLCLAEMFPDADIFTAVYDAAGTEGRFEGRTVKTSFLQRLSPDSDSFRRYLPFYPRAIESLDLSGYDLVISSSSAWAHGARVAPGAVHVCYCHNPFRYAWNERDATLAARSLPVRLPLSFVLSRWRDWDRRAAQRVDRYVANSETTKYRIAAYLGRQADVVYPPVEIDRFSPGVRGERFVVLSELMAHKRIAVAVSACTELGLPLTVIGDGPDGDRLRSLAGDSVEFLGRVSDQEVSSRLQTARGLIVTATEEFGIAAVEAQAAGCPVIALDEGGLRETVVEGRTGTFFARPAVPELCAALEAFEPASYPAAACVENARRFSPAVFEQAIERVVAEELDRVRAGSLPAGQEPEPAPVLAGRAR
ncbi:MAG: glycosyltransferase [Baekduia sp.]